MDNRSKLMALWQQHFGDDKATSLLKTEIQGHPACK
jgi:hypothetical protein